MDLTSATKPKSASSLWLTLLFAAQPCLDVLAFFTRNETATPAGYIRLVLLVLLPVLVFFRTKKKKEFLLFLLGTGLFCLLHFANSWRHGYISPVTDIRYLAGVVQMPVFAFCFLLLIRDETTKTSALRGVWIGAALTLVFFVLARVTDTGNVTYGEGLGYSGWVIDENRNANSTNLVIYACFCVLLALSCERRWARILIPLAIDLLFLSNGTKGCYFSIFGIFVSFACFLILDSVWLRHEWKKDAVAVLLLLSVVSAVIYPWTPRYKVTQAQQATALGTQGEIEATLLEKGIDITDMSPRERFDNPEVKEVFIHYYWKYLGVKPDIIDRFGMDRVLMQYQMSTNVAKLIDARVMERNYADMVFQDSDLPTKLVGFEVSQMGPNGYDGSYDMENDWHAILYYYGFLGFALYIGFMLYFLLRIVRRLRRDGIGCCFTLENFSYLLTLVLIVGLAHFSGATLRRPNVSIWLSLVLALLYYVTEVHADEA
ncbi:MAG: O-antigen ligase family protein [Oscillospiraceae bacterium]|nr:O-antigen ligase family protein [Oscillospiraceae bacterium]